MGWSLRGCSEVSHSKLLVTWTFKDIKKIKIQRGIRFFLFTVESQQGFVIDKFFYNDEKGIPPLSFSHLLSSVNAARIVHGLYLGPWRNWKYYWDNSTKTRVTSSVDVESLLINRVPLFRSYTVPKYSSSRERVRWWSVPPPPIFHPWNHLLYSQTQFLLRYLIKHHIYICQLGTYYDHNPHG